MSRSHRAMGLLLVAIVGAWGCAKSPGGGNASGDKNPALEAKAQRLEEDFRAAAAARDQFRMKLLAAEEKATAAEARASQLRATIEESRTVATSLTAERDGLKAELKNRTTERDNLATQYEAFRKNIKTLIGQAESTATVPTIPATVGVIAPVPATSALNN